MEGFFMRVIPLTGYPGDPDAFDKRQVTTLAEGACFLCEGWGYPNLDFIPQRIKGKMAVRVKGPACKVCGGSGLDPKKHTAAELAAGRAPHRARIDKLVLWTVHDVERRAKESRQ
jgi:hypothetical protein